MNKNFFLKKSNLFCLYSREECCEERNTSGNLVFVFVCVLIPLPVLKKFYREKNMSSRPSSLPEPWIKEVLTITTTLFNSGGGDGKIDLAKAIKYIIGKFPAQNPDQVTAQVTRKWNKEESRVRMEAMAAQMTENTTPAVPSPTLSTATTITPAKQTVSGPTVSTSVSVKRNNTDSDERSAKKFKKSKPSDKPNEKKEKKRSKRVRSISPSPSSDESSGKNKKTKKTDRQVVITADKQKKTPVNTNDEKVPLLQQQTTVTSSVPVLVVSSPPSLQSTPIAMSIDDSIHSSLIVQKRSSMGFSKSASVGSRQVTPNSLIFGQGTSSQGFKPPLSFFQADVLFEAISNSMNNPRLYKWQSLVPVPVTIIPFSGVGPKVRPVSEIAKSDKSLGVVAVKVQESKNSLALTQEMARQQRIAAAQASATVPQLRGNNNNNNINAMGLFGRIAHVYSRTELRSDKAFVEMLLCPYYRVKTLGKDQFVETSYIPDLIQQHQGTVQGENNEALTMALQLAVNDSLRFFQELHWPNNTLKPTTTRYEPGVRRSNFLFIEWRKIMREMGEFRKPWVQRGQQVATIVVSAASTEQIIYPTLFLQTSWFRYNDPFAEINSLASLNSVYELTSAKAGNNNHLVQVSPQQQHDTTADYRFDTLYRLMQEFSPHSHFARNIYDGSGFFTIRPQQQRQQQQRHEYFSRLQQKASSASSRFIELQNNLQVCLENIVHAIESSFKKPVSQEDRQLISRVLIRLNRFYFDSTLSLDDDKDQKDHKESVSKNRWKLIAEAMNNPSSPGLILLPPSGGGGGGGSSNKSGRGSGSSGDSHESILLSSALQSSVIGSVISRKDSFGNWLAEHWEKLSETINWSTVASPAMAMQSELQLPLRLESPDQYAETREQRLEEIKVLQMVRRVWKTSTIIRQHVSGWQADLDTINKNGHGILTLIILSRNQTWLEEFLSQVWSCRPWLCSNKFVVFLWCNRFVSTCLEWIDSINYPHTWL